MRILLRDHIGASAPWPDGLTTLAIVGASAGQLLVPHIIESDLTRNWLGLVGYLPAGLFLVTQGILWQRSYRAESLPVRQASGLFLALGLTAYAVAVALGFIIYRAENVHRSLEFLAAPLALAGLPLLLGGMIASEKLQASSEIGEPGGLSLGVAKVIATLLALGGALVMLAALTAAWPSPIRLIVIGSINAVVLALTAYRFRLLAAYIPALVCLVIAVLTGYHFLAGHLDVARDALGLTLWRAFMAPESGVVLTILAALLAVAAEWLVRAGRADDGRALAIGSAASALVSLLLVGVDGWDSPVRAASVFAAVAIAGWIANVRWRQAWLTFASATAAFGAAFFGVRYSDSELSLSQIVAWSLLAGAVIAVALAAVVDYFTRKHDPDSESEFRRAFSIPLETASLGASAAGVLMLLPALAWDWLTPAALVAVGQSGVWLALAWRQRQSVLFAAFQSGLVVAVLFGVVRILQEQPWFTNKLESPVNDIRAWQAYGLGLGALALTFVASRFLLQRSERAWKLLEPGWSRWLLGGLVILALIITVIGVAPGVAEELTPTEYGISSMSATPSYVASPAGWCWLALLAAAVVLCLWQGQIGISIPGLVVISLSAVGLMAATFSSDLAIASALRWGLAILFLAGSAFVWRRDNLLRIANSLAIPTEASIPIASAVRGILIAGAAAPILLITVGVASIGFARLHPSGPAAESLFHNLGVVINNIGPLVLLCLGLAGHAVRAAQRWLRLRRRPGRALFSGWRLRAGHRHGRRRHRDRGVGSTRAISHGRSLSLAPGLAGRGALVGSGRGHRPYRVHEGSFL